jgi:glycosyltransferase involved in cell wall biosynthesis
MPMIPFESPPPVLSLVVPMFNESENLEYLFGKLRGVLDGLGVTYEIVCVDDGSRDDTLARLIAMHHADPRLKIIALARNFGKEAALTAGLEHARGQAVLPIDADLQDPPELIPQLLAKWREGFEVVLAKRRSRDSDTPLKRFTSTWFYRVFNRLSDRPIPENVGDFQLLDRRAVEALKRLPERNRVMKGLFAWVGFRRAEVLFDRAPRHAGETKWNYWKLFQLAFNAITSHSRRPLHLASLLGLAVSLGAIAYAAFLTVLVVSHGRDVPGYASLMVGMLFLGGVQLISIGIVGEYVGRVYDEVKQRPLYITREVIGFDSARE